MLYCSIGSEILYMIVSVCFFYLVPTTQKCMHEYCSKYLVTSYAWWSWIGFYDEKSWTNHSFVLIPDTGLLSSHSFAHYVQYLLSKNVLIFKKLIRFCFGWDLGEGWQNYHEIHLASTSLLLCVRVHTWIFCTLSPIQVSIKFVIWIHFIEQRLCLF